MHTQAKETFSKNLKDDEHLKASTTVNKMTFRGEQPNNEPLSEFVRDDISDDEDDMGFSRAQTTEQQAMWKEIEKFRLHPSQHDVSS